MPLEGIKFCRRFFVREQGSFLEQGKQGRQGRQGRQGEQGDNYKFILQQIASQS